MLHDRWAPVAWPDKPKEVSAQVVALRGPLLSTQSLPWLPCLTLLAHGLPFTGLGVLVGRGIYLGMYEFVLASGLEWDPCRDGG